MQPIIMVSYIRCSFLNCKFKIDESNPCIKSSNCEHYTCMRCLLNILDNQNDKRWISSNCILCSTLNLFDIIHI